MPVVPTLLLELGSLQRGPSSSTDSGQAGLHLTPSPGGLCCPGLTWEKPSISGRPASFVLSLGVVKAEKAGGF